jgi:predicted porin
MHSTQRAIALALAALPLAAAAQNSNLQIYGLLDAGLELARNGNGTATRVQSGVMLGSRLGFRGVEDLGGGLKARFVLEHGFNVDDGTAAGGPMWGRRSVVGLENAWGTLLLGRDYSPARFVALNADRMDFGLYGNLQTIARVGGGAGTRVGNALHFTSQPIAGAFTVRAALGFGEERFAAPKELGRFAGLAVEYRKDKLYAGIGVNTRYDAVGPANAPTGAARMREGGIGLNYDFGGFELNGGTFAVDGNGANDTTRSWWLGAGVPVGPGTFLAQFGVTDPDGPGRATTYGLAYTYALSRRTTVYAAHGRVNNNAQTGYSLNTAVPTIPAAGLGDDPRGLAVGMVHRF